MNNMNIYPDVFNILATHLEMDEKGRGRYQNKFLPPEKVGAIYQDLCSRIEKELAETKNQGKKEMLVGFQCLFESTVEELKKDTGMKYNEPQFIKQLWEKQ